MQQKIEWRGKMTVVILAIAIQAAAPAPPPKAAPAFVCADQLVAKNHALAAETAILAHRITDECYTQPPADTEGRGATTPEQWQSLRADFQKIVHNRIVAARAKSLKLVR